MTGDAGRPGPGGDEPFAAVAETHSGVVFFAGDRAYKLKKPIRTGFLDFSTPEAREAACRRETELNRRFSPDVYLGVAQVRDADGRVCDHLVVMRRMPGGRRLSALLRRGEPADGPVRAVARALAAQHAAAPRGALISAEGGRDALWRRWRENVEQARPLAAGLLPAAEIDEVDQRAGMFLAGRAPLFDARVRAGRIVDGHGDLLADDVFCLADGPRVLDCLEFDDRLRWLDGLDDAAFLAMDLERLGARDLAERFIGWYAEFSGDPAPPSLVHHYVAYRAFVRAKVACLRAAQGDPASGGQARLHMALALRHLRAGEVSVVLVGGLPGTGKSSLAQALAERLGWVVLASDRVRKELAGLEPDQPAPAAYGSGIYAPAWTERAYAELLSRAEAALASGESVLLDATWTSARWRSAAADMARRARARLVPLRCTAPQEVAGRRMLARTSGPSDADPGIAARLAAEEDPWPQAVTLETAEPEPPGPPGQAGPPEPVIARALAAIRPHGPEHVWRPARPYMAPG